MLVAFAAPAASAQARLTLHLRSGTTLCDIATWTREGTDVRVEVAEDGTTLLIPRDSVASAWVVSATAPQNRARGAQFGALIGAATPLLIALVAPGGTSSVYGDVRRANLTFGLIVAPFTAIAGAFFGYVVGSGSEAKWWRDESLAPLRAPDDERAARARAEVTCR
jgi:hypothetical protein